MGRYKVAYDGSTVWKCFMMVQQFGRSKINLKIEIFFLNLFFEFFLCKIIY